jgi:DNA helicase-2/ATP-dependent DNA helicase PcrA
MPIELSKKAAAALDEPGGMLVLGGPGSGKTTLSLLKTQRLVEGLEPGQRILFLSFSRAAVRQVLARCNDVLTRSDRQSIVVKTYHAFCIDLLRAHGRLLTGSQPRLYYPGAERVARAAFDGDWEAERARLATEEGLYTFDLFAGCCADLLARSLAVRQHVAEMYPVIILDEFQDTNDSQWDLVKQLGEGSRLIVLADQDQRIFEYDTSVDPRRLDLLREFVEPAEFDLGGANHRSPDAAVLQFADAVLHNTALPTTSDVTQLPYWPKAFDSTVHFAVLRVFAELRRAGVEEPTVAVLCRANSLVADVSNLLETTHTYNKATLDPVDHDVLWDEDLVASAAQVVASILEWPHHSAADRAAMTLRSVARYFEMKNAVTPSQTARDKASRYAKAADACATGATPKPAAAKELAEAAQSGIAIVGDPRADWFEARAVVSRIKDLAEVFTNARFVRLFRASDEIGRHLSDRWAARGSYDGATEIVRQALEVARVMGDQREHRGCTVMSMHKSKGKEFDGVVLVEGTFKGKFFDVREAPPFLASRRVLRVAITRARHRVAIVRPRGSAPLVG